MVVPRRYRLIGYALASIGSLGAAASYASPYVVFDNNAPAPSKSWKFSPKNETYNFFRALGFNGS